MGPSRECDGDPQPAHLEGEQEQLQWGRRVNATETGGHHEGSAGHGHGASMGPSRECDGDPRVCVGALALGEELQWGRRVNATET